MTKRKRLNNTAVLAFYNARERRGDTKEIAEMTDYSENYISRMKNGSRRMNNGVADAMFILSHDRKKNSVMSER